MIKAAILDDEVWALRDLEKLISEKENFKIVHKSTDPYETMEYIFKEHVDILFTDIKMPGLTGLDCARMIMDKGINTIVVIISGYDDFEYARESIRNDVFDYLLKPVMKDELYNVIDKIQSVLCNESNFENNELASGNELFQKIIDFINQNYAKDIKLIDVAKQNYISERYVEQLFKKNSKMSFLQYLTRLRMEKSKILLKTTKKSMTEIGREVGYPNSSYFNKVFKKFYNQTPNNFRKGETYENKRHEV